ncbi:MAG TPA: sulfotransferase [Thermoleophilaceae bacterium]|nr:sulfotransferase [Thermoleophilaceae bacterium]
MIFNVGARRSGTYWLQRITCAHPAVAEVPSETYVFSHGIAPLMERFHHGERDFVDVGLIYADREKLIAAIRNLCDTVFGEFATEGQTHAAERTPWHVSHLPLIAEVYPEARFVHIIRDGRDVARSIVAQPWGPTTVEGAAEEWRSSVVAGREAAGLLGDRLIEVRYEEVLAEPRPAIERIYAHHGLDGGIEEALAAAGRKANIGKQDKRVGTGKWQEDWKRRDIRDFDRAAGDLLRELGYDQGAGVSAG